MKPCAAFSLIEVVLSLGIVSFAFVSLLGLLPVGYQTFRRAIETSAQARIIQNVVTEMEMARYSDVNASGYATAHFPQYFDDQGNRLTSGSDATLIYTVTSDKVTHPLLPGDSTQHTQLLILGFSIQQKNRRSLTNHFSITVSNNGD